MTGIVRRPAARHITARPTASALGQLMGAVAAGVPFCVSPAEPSGLDTIGAGQFATLTGGTSTDPKVILRTHASWTASFTVHADRFGLGPGETVATLGTLDHSLALYATVEAMHLGATLLPLASQPVGMQRRHLAHADVLYATPTQLRLLTRDMPGPIARLRLILCGGGALDPITRDATAALFPNAALHVFYGAAETSFITLGDASTPEGAVGVPYPGVELRFTDGVIETRSPYAFLRYLGSGSPHTRWTGDWLSLGEHGWQDADGNLYLSGRAGRSITVADRTLFLDEITAHLAPLAYPHHVAILAFPDALRGNRVEIIVSGEPDPALAAGLSKACTDHSGLRPMVRFRTDFPLRPSGKPDLAALGKP